MKIKVRIRVVSVFITWQLLMMEPVQSIKRDRRMIGGLDADPDEWNFAFSMTFFQPNPRLKICSATAVDKQWLVTAAHCVEDIQSQPNYLQINMNGRREEERGSRQSKQLGVEKIVVHPMHKVVNQFTSHVTYSWDFDIALLKLSEKIPRPMVAGVTGGEETNVTDCKSAGWGSNVELDSSSGVTTKNYQISDSLKEIYVPLVPWHKCHDFHTKNHKRFALVNNHVVCGGSIGTKNRWRRGGCIGDSGSPLVCNTKQGRVLYGILLGGNPSCKQGIDFMIFTKVGHYRSWIQKHITED